MREFCNYGGKAMTVDENASSKMAVVDLIFFDLEKKKKEDEMMEQYKEVAALFELADPRDLMILSYCWIQMHVLLSRKNTSFEHLKIHVASSAVAKHVHGHIGTSKYLIRIRGGAWELTYGLHPQGLLLGIGKNEAVYNKSLQRIMAKHLLMVYKAVHPTLNIEYESKCIEIFGSKFAGVDIGMYSYIARVMDDAGALNIDKVVNATDPESVRSFLRRRDVSDVIISFIVNEIEGATTLVLFMNRIRKCRAGQRMQCIASQLPNTASSLSDLPDEGMRLLISGLSTTLGQTTDVVLRKLQRMKTAQDNNGERLSSLS
jgi:hypothetical protein